MTKIWTAQEGNKNDDGYNAYLERVSARYVTAASKYPVFVTDADDLWTRYMEVFAPHDQQVHNCNACRHFIERYAGLVVINPDTGETVSALWVVEDAPAEYRPSVRAMKAAAEKAKVVAPFHASERILGQPKTGIWTHLYVANPVVYTDRVKTAYQRMAEQKQDYLMVLKALAAYPQEVAEKAVNLLRAEALYRSPKFLGPAEWFLNLHKARNALTGSVRNNMIWLAVATAPAGYTHISNTVVGSLLQDLQQGLQFEDVKRRFAATTNVATYQRAQTAPAAGTLAQAEKLFDTLGLAPALPRRYARLDDIRMTDTLWVPRSASPAKMEGSALFGHLAPKGSTPPVADLSVPPKDITWEKFQEKVLPLASRIEVVVPDTSARFMALTTAVNSDAPPILQWDREGTDRNPFSWYYASGVDAEVRKRVVSAGGQYADVDLRASLIWNNLNDLDIHCVTPTGEHIYFGNREDRYGGKLDIDANANCVSNVTDTPVENIRWPKGRAREGHYRFYVHHYATMRGRMGVTPFRVELEVNGEVFYFDGQTSRVGQQVVVAELDYDRNGAVRNHAHLRKAVAEPFAWLVTPGTYVQVTAIVPSPNLWGGLPLEHCGQHAFFLLEGVRDTAKGVGRGFFPEQLRGDLHPVRSVMEAYAASAEIEGADLATACGIGISKQDTGGLVVRATTSTGQMLYKLDRWE